MDRQAHEQERDRDLMPDRKVEDQGNGHEQDIETGQDEGGTHDNPVFRGGAGNRTTKR